MIKKLPKRLYSAIILFFVFFVFSMKIVAQTNYTVTKTLKIDSEVYKTKRTILVKTPADYDRTKTNYPTIYILDAGDGLKFDFYCQTIDNLVQHEEIPQVIIVGIVADGKRNYEFTPVSNNPKHKNYGGAEQFLKFLQSDAVPYIEGNFRTNNFRALVSHSFGALFGIYSLVKRPDLFNSVIAISPTLWYNDGLYIEELGSLAKKCPSPHSFFFAVGDEGETETSLRPSVMQLYEKLKAQDCARFHWQLLELHDKNHRTTPIFAVPEALSAIFKPWKIPALLQKNIDESVGDPLTLLEKHADFRKKHYGISFDWSENDYVYLLALPYLEQKNMLRAKVVLEEALTFYPNSSLIFECLGDLAILEKDTEKAKKNYETALKKLQTKESAFAEEIKEKMSKIAQ